MLEAFVLWLLGTQNMDRMLLCIYFRLVGPLLMQYGRCLQQVSRTYFLEGKSEPLESVLNFLSAALVGESFGTEEQHGAFASFRMWQSFGFMLSFGTSHFLCFDVKLFFTLAWLSFSFICFLIGDKYFKGRS